MSVGIQVTSLGAEEIGKRLAAVERVRLSEVLDAVGALVASQTKRRIAEERTAPDGTPWQAWSIAYAKTRHGGHSLLRSEGDLEDSIQHLSGLDEVEVGTNLVYAAVHQFGDRKNAARLASFLGVSQGAHLGGIPPRPFLGLSRENEEEILELIESKFLPAMEEGA